MSICNPEAPSAPECSATLHSLYAAYLKVIAGGQAQAVQTADFRRVDYTPANVDALVEHYNLLWDQCGAESGLPRLTKPGASTVRRGGPGRFRC